MKYLILIFICNALLLADWGKSHKLYYAVEMNNQLVGYATIDISKDPQGNPLCQSEVYARMTLVGGFANYKHNEKVKFSANYRPYFYENNFEQGQMKGGAITYITEGKARIISKSGGGLKTLKLPSQVQFEVYPYYSFLRTFSGKKHSYPIFNDLLKAVHTVSYEKVGTETITAGGKQYSATVFTRSNQDLAEQEKLWIDITTGQVLKSKSSSSTVYLASKSVIDKVISIPKSVRYVNFKSLENTTLQENKIYKYRYLHNGKDIGNDSFSFRRNKSTYSFHAKLNIKSLQTTTMWQVKPNLEPIFFDLKGSGEGVSYAQTCKFKSTEIIQTYAKNLKQQTKKIKKQEGIYLFSASNIGIFSMFMSAVPLKKNNIIVTKVFNATIGKFVSMKCKIIGEEKIFHNNKEVNTWKIDILLGSEVIYAWIDTSGNLLRKEYKQMIVELIVD
ncbi:hypothetical protein [Candidatus Uabimicrobium sp. HlEnr_7]|uniref:hypothetical protein n=1 Tax=Candidatus Uabimicrobium helgolandensis TaxID=3095367 RepID=UPI0035560EDC